MCSIKVLAGMLWVTTELGPLLHGPALIRRDRRREIRLSVRFWAQLSGANPAHCPDQCPDQLARPWQIRQCRLEGRNAVPGGGESF